MRDNTYCLLMAECGCIAALIAGIVIHNDAIAAGALGGLLGVLGGHMNGSQPGSTQ